MLLSLDRSRKWARRSLFFDRGDHLKAVIYCRVDGPENPFSVDAIRGQELELLNYAEKHGIEVTSIYLDVGYSGRTLDRPGLCSAMQAVKDNKADTILVVNRSRPVSGALSQRIKESPAVRQLKNRTY